MPGVGILNRSASVLRGAAQAGIPPILNDGNTVKWFDYLENVTKDESNLVSSWDNKSGVNGIIPGALLQSEDLDKPTLTIDGVLFPGVREFMKCATFTLEQPTQIYIVFRQLSWTNSLKVFDGNTINTGVLYQSIASPYIRTYAGKDNLYDDKLSINSFGIVRVLFNGANSALQIDEETEKTGDSGLNDMNGFTLGANGSNLLFGHIEVKEIIIRKINDTSDNKSIIYDYLKKKYFS